MLRFLPLLFSSSCSLIRGADVEAAASHPSLVQGSDINDDVLSASDPPNETACLAEPTDSMGDNSYPRNHWAASGTDIEPANYLSPSTYSSTRADTTSLSADQVSNVWGSWTDLGLFDFGGNAYDPSWLVGASFDINALTSSISTTGSPWVYGDTFANLTQCHPSERSNEADNVDESTTGNNMRNLVRDRWYTRPTIESASPFALKRPENPDRVDEAYRAGLSSRLRPSLQDDVLPSADFLVCSHATNISRPNHDRSS